MTIPDAPSGELQLSDGRVLAWYDFGASSGRPAFYFHGFPGSGIEACWANDIAREHGVRLIGVDRPGYGYSSFHPQRTILQWAEDVGELAGHLGVGEFEVIGMSGGGPYALACGARMPDRTGVAHVVSGFGPVPAEGPDRGLTPFNRIGLLLAQRPTTSWVLDAGGPLVKYVLRNHTDIVLTRLRAQVCPLDREALDGTDLGTVLQESFRRSVRVGIRGMVAEARLFARFDGGWLGEIEGPVTWWHGERDSVVPASMARRAEAIIPRCSARYLPEDGHFSVLANHLGEVFESA